jgi:hypothetical protein
MASHRTQLTRVQRKSLASFADLLDLQINAPRLLRWVIGHLCASAALDFLPQTLPLQVKTFLQSRVSGEGLSEQQRDVVRVICQHCAPLDRCPASVVDFFEHLRASTAVGAGERDCPVCSSPQSAHANCDAPKGTRRCSGVAVAHYCWQIGPSGAGVSVEMAIALSSACTPSRPFDPTRRQTSARTARAFHFARTTQRSCAACTVPSTPRRRSLEASVVFRAGRRQPTSPPPPPHPTFSLWLVALLGLGETSQMRLFVAHWLVVPRRCSAVQTTVISVESSSSW